MRTGETLLGLASAAALLFASELRAANPSISRRGPFAFQYAPRLSAAQLEWYSRFDVLVTHDPLPPAQVRALREAGTKLLFYEWAVAFYEARATSWQRSLLRDRSRRLLHESPLTGGVGSATAAAWYFDPAHASFAEERATELVTRLDETGYDGVFFDTTRLESVHPAARQEFERRHPETTYDEAFARFLRELRRRGPLIFTNQGYRSAEHYLPHADWDLSESLITRPAAKRADVRAWNDSRDPWNSIHFVLRTMIEPLAAQYPGVRFAHLNYVDAPATDAIHVAVAAAQLFGGEAYVAAESFDHECSEIYFRDPGTAEGPRIDWEDGTGAHRFFTNGLIVVNAGGGTRSIDLAGRTVRNHVTGELICGGAVQVAATNRDPRAWFFDFVDEGCTQPAAVER